MTKSGHGIGQMERGNGRALKNGSKHFAFWRSICLQGLAFCAQILFDSIDFPMLRTNQPIAPEVPFRSPVGNKFGLDPPMHNRLCLWWHFSLQNRLQFVISAKPQCSFLWQAPSQAKQATCQTRTPFGGNPPNVPTTVSLPIVFWHYQALCG